MTSLTLDEYEEQSRSLVFDVMACGETLRVDCGDAGVFFVVRDDKFEPKPEGSQ